MPLEYSPKCVLGYWVRTTSLSDLEVFFKIVFQDSPLRVLLTGYPGSGKTFFIKLLALQWAQGAWGNNLQALYLLPASKWHQDQAKAIFQHCFAPPNEEAQGTQLLQQIEESLQQTTTLVVVDGVEELAKGSAEDLFKEAKQGKYQLLLTARPDGVQTYFKQAPYTGIKVGGLSLNNGNKIWENLLHMTLAMREQEARAAIASLVEEHELSPTIRDNLEKAISQWKEEHLDCSRGLLSYIRQVDSNLKDIQLLLRIPSHAKIIISLCLHPHIYKEIRYGRLSGLYESFSKAVWNQDKEGQEQQGNPSESASEVPWDKLGQLALYRISRYECYVPSKAIDQLFKTKNDKEKFKKNCLATGLLRWVDPKEAISSPNSYKLLIPIMCVAGVVLSLVAPKTNTIDRSPQNFQHVIHGIMYGVGRFFGGPMPDSCIEFFYELISLTIYNLIGSVIYRFSSLLLMVVPEEFYSFLPTAIYVVSNLVILVGPKLMDTAQCWFTPRAFYDVTTSLEEYFAGRWLASKCLSAGVNSGKAKRLIQPYNHSKVFVLCLEEILKQRREVEDAFKKIQAAKGVLTKYREVEDVLTQLGVAENALTKIQDAKEVFTKYREVEDVLTQLGVAENALTRVRNSKGTPTFSAMLELVRSGSSEFDELKQKILELRLWEGWLDLMGSNPETDAFLQELQVSLANNLERWLRRIIELLGQGNQLVEKQLPILIRAVSLTGKLLKKDIDPNILSLLCQTIKDQDQSINVRQKVIQSLRNLEPVDDAIVQTLETIVQDTTQNKYVHLEAIASLELLESRLPY